VGPLPRRSMFALRATGAVAATAAHAASFGNPDERPQGAVNANGGIQKLHWHQVAEWTFMTYGRCPAVYGVLRMVQSVLTIGTPGVMLSFGPFAMIYFIVLGGAAMLFLLRLFARSPAAGEAGPSDRPQTCRGYHAWTISNRNRIPVPGFAGKVEPGAHHH
jgi:cytochrome bd-type quinol oxidase subunit 1